MTCLPEQLEWFSLVLRHAVLIYSGLAYCWAMLYSVYFGLWHALLALLDIPAAGALCRQRAANLASLYASSATRSCYVGPSAPGAACMRP